MFIDLRTEKTRDLRKTFLKEFAFHVKITDPFNPLYLAFSTGARCTWGQVFQIFVQRGRMVNMSGNALPHAIRKSFTEGVGVRDFVFAGFGARRGLVDTGVRTAEAGYLTRRMVCVAQGCFVNEDDCFSEHHSRLTELYPSQSIGSFVTRLVLACFRKNNLGSSKKSNNFKT